MNSTPKPPTVTNIKQYPTEFQQIISEKSANFVGREFVFSAINNFLSRQNRGYFTIVGAPGSGKSAILAKYVSENPQVIYYNAEVAGKNRADEFLAIVCSQLVTGDWGLGTGDLVVPDNATSGSWFLSLLLQKISDLLAPNQKLIIAIDALDAIDSTNIPPGSNLFYLPRYLPEKVYFLLTRRPFLREKSGLLIETPAEVLNLAAYPAQNREDIQLYIRQYLLNNHQLNEPEFITELTAKSENNFMYVSQILPVIVEEELRNPGSPKETGFLSPGLAAYYQNHWQRMTGKGLDSLALAVLNILSQQKQPISAELIAEMIDEDEYDVEEVLESWREFLDWELIKGETFYRFYHADFRDWLSKRLGG